MSNAWSGSFSYRRNVNAHTGASEDVKQCDIKKLKKVFKDLKERVLAGVEESGREIKDLVQCIMDIPAELRDASDVRYLKENVNELYACESVRAVFSYIGFHMDYLNPDIYQHLIAEFNLDSLVAPMEKYKDMLEQSLQYITLQTFCSIDGTKYTPDPPKGFVKFVSKHKWEGNVSMKQVIEFRAKCASQYDVRDCAVWLVGITKGCVLITLLVPKAIVPAIQATSEAFFQKYSIINLEVIHDGECIYMYDYEPDQVKMKPLSLEKVSQPVSGSYIHDFPYHQADPVAELDEFATEFTGDVVHSKSTYSPVEKGEADDESDTSDIIDAAVLADDNQTQELDFVQQPSFEFECPITYNVLLEPHQTDCCGNHLSREAVAIIAKQEKPCPLCKKSSFTTHPDINFRRQVHQLSVFCPHKKRGCEWQGELFNLEKHTESCPRRDSPIILLPENVRGAEIVARTSLQVAPGESSLYEWNGHGLKLHIPANVLEENTISIDIQASINGNYQLPKYTELVSGVYWIEFPGKFSRPVTLELQHSASLESSKLSQLNFVTAKCHDKAKPCKFELEAGGTFLPNSSYGTVQMSVSSGFAVVRKNYEKTRYTLHTYYIPHAPTTCQLHVVIIPDLQLYLQAVKMHYSRKAAEYGQSLEVVFNRDRVTLDLPDESMTLPNGWALIPEIYPAMILKDIVDSYKPGGEIPSCRVQLRWTKTEEHPKGLEHKLKITGLTDHKSLTICRNTTSPSPTTTRAPRLSPTPTSWIHPTASDSRLQASSLPSLTAAGPTTTRVPRLPPTPTSWIHPTASDSRLPAVASSLPSLTAAEQGRSVSRNKKRISPHLERRVLYAQHAHLSRTLRASEIMADLYSSGVIYVSTMEMVDAAITTREKNKIILQELKRCRYPITALCEALDKCASLRYVAYDLRTALEKKRREYDQRSNVRLNVSSGQLQVFKKKLTDAGKQFVTLTTKLAAILDRYPEALQNMKIALTTIYVVVEDEQVEAVIKSHEFIMARTASDLFRAFAVAKNVLDDEMMETLVQASQVDEAIERFETYKRARDPTTPLVVFESNTPRILLPPPASSEAAAVGVRELVVRSNNERLAVGDVGEMRESVSGALDLPPLAISPQGVIQS